MQIVITEEYLNELKAWFINYVHTFQSGDPEIQQNIDLKEHHTMRVCKEMCTIGKQLELNDNELRLAEIIGLLHDVGRFEQYSRYRTFRDKDSENHAELGIKILNELAVLESIDKPTQEIILQAIKYHNQHSLPSDLNDQTLFFAQLIRDADKLDIWSVVIDNYHQKEDLINRAIQLTLPDTPGISEEVYHDLISRQIVKMKFVRNLNDLKLLQVGWIYDINFQPTLKCIKERRYLERLEEILPKSKKTDEIFDVISATLNENVYSKAVSEN